MNKEMQNRPNIQGQGSFNRDFEKSNDQRVTNPKSNEHLKGHMALLREIIRDTEE